MRLCINIDHIATLRNARGGALPDPVTAALLCEEAGADGIVCHLREDRRHIRDEDVRRLRSEIGTKLDLEMSVAPEIVRIALRTRSDLVTLVPEKRKELTTEGGLDVVRDQRRLKRVIHQMHDRGIPVSLFIDPTIDQIEMAKEIGADMIEIHTGAYADARMVSRRRVLLEKIQVAARHAHRLEMAVNAGHGLEYGNVSPIVKIREIEEVSIGHAIIVRAVAVGLKEAVREMVRLVTTGK